MEYTFFATCPRLIEGLLLEELTQLGAVRCKETVAGVYFDATLETAYKACLWSRLANHILLPLDSIEAHDQASLYRGVQSIDWSTHFSPQQSLKINFTGQSDFINNTQYGAQAVKDAIVDQFRERFNERPEVDLYNPDIRIHAHLHFDTLHLSLSLSGESLHKRGYRQDPGAAPLKENLAAAILIRSGFAKNWQHFTYLIDPMCGSATLLIEAAMMVMDIAPGLSRDRFGFSAWRLHQQDVWEKLLADAIARKKTQCPIDIRGYDASPRAITQARDNIEQAGLTKYIDLSVRELSNLSPPTHFGERSGFLITNPPYGERLGDVETLKPLYQHLGLILREKFVNWQVALFTGNPDLGKVMGIRAKKQYAFLNGTIPCKLLLLDITPEWFVLNKAPAIETKPIEYTLPPEAEMFANRLRKNFKALQTWIKQNDIHCYRVYDADMPEYAVAIDCYEQFAHVQEYAPPKTIDPQKAAQRLNIVLQSIPAVLGIAPDCIITKQRREQKDHSQYQKMNNHGEMLTVQEGPAKLLVNLYDYLDTGLFLDHRPLRLHFAQIAKGKRFLNLFCYTGAVTVHAALGGAYHSISVDMSTTYTHWARRNFALNGLSENLHRVIQADCLRWLEQNHEQFDLIFLDPPTFSRSKRMNDDFDVQRDHVSLIRKVLPHLAPDGVLYFSNNCRTFKLDEAALSDLKIENITAKTLDKDFLRDPKIHCCFKIQFAQANNNPCL
jgi:23S rRNA (guanine2445-N2)-methyltransferase / 23S rRNA (guanine2069-N7)-methyltransferase